MKEIIYVLLGGGLLTFIQFLIARRDNRHDSHKEVMDAFGKLEGQFDELKRENEEQHMRNRRIRILRFNDELIDGKKHTHELFLDILDDIETYEKYCAENKDFANGRTKYSCKNIHRVYDDLLEQGEFKHGGEA